jgi:hypothetical protein
MTKIVASSIATEPRSALRCSGEKPRPRLTAICRRPAGQRHFDHRLRQPWPHRPPRQKQNRRPRPGPRWDLATALAIEKRRYPIWIALEALTPLHVTVTVPVPATEPTSTASTSRPSTSSKPSRSAAKAAPLRWPDWTSSVPPAAEPAPLTSNLQSPSSLFLTPI